LNTRRLTTFPAVARIPGDLTSAPRPAEHDEDVIQMNELHPRASEWVQRDLRSFIGMISEPGHSTGDLRDPPGRGD
jgi:hypothetical protein